MFSCCVNSTLARNLKPTVLHTLKFDTWFFRLPFINCEWILLLAIQVSAVIHVWKVTLLASVTNVWSVTTMTCVHHAMRPVQRHHVTRQIIQCSAFLLELILVLCNFFLYPFISFIFFACVDSGCKNRDSSVYRLEVIKRLSNLGSVLASAYESVLAA